MELVPTATLFDLAGKAAIVTGGARGIGEAIARRLASCGARVAIVDVLETEAARAVEDIRATGGDASSFMADLRRQDEITHVTQTIADRFGGIDILVNNAGVVEGWSSWEQMTREQWDRSHAVNETAVFFMAQAAATRMVAQGRGGAIVNVASTASVHPVRWKPDYSAAKAAVAMITKSLALELGAHMIRVNAVGPGGTTTPGSAALKTGDFPAERIEALRKDWRARMAMPVGRLDADDVARAVLFFACDASRHVTGQYLAVDGGYLIG